MSYMRGDVYIWADGEGVHFWSAEGYDGWDDSGWAEGRVVADNRTLPTLTGPSGINLRQEIADAYVMMRLAELIAEGDVGAAIDRALEQSGNGGCAALQERGAALRLALAPLVSEHREA